jgi:hypothetical protein
MNPLLRSRMQMFGAWCAIGYVVTVSVGWGLLAGFLPPTPPTATASEIAALYASDYTRIRIGMVVVMISALVFVPFGAVLGQFLARIEGGAGVLTYSCLLGSAGTMMLTFYPAIWWLVAAFRPDRAADSIYLMNDLAWLQLVGGVTVFLAMPLSVLVAALADRSARPVFPRWCGYANGWLALLIVPDQLLFFFHRGPFAWNGIFGLWIPFAAFGGFHVLNFWVIRKAILRETGAAAAPASMEVKPLSSLN